MLPAIRDLDVPVVLVNVQKLKALDYEHTDIASWLGEGYACGAVGEAVARPWKELENDMLLSLVLLRAVILVFRQKIEDWCKLSSGKKKIP